MTEVSQRHFLTTFKSPLKRMQGVTGKAATLKTQAEYVLLEVCGL